MKAKLETYSSEADKACSGALKDFSFKSVEMTQMLHQATKAADLVNSMLACAPAAGWTADSASSHGEEPKKKKKLKDQKEESSCISLAIYRLRHVACMMRHIWLGSGL